MLKAFVVVATKGRAKETFELLNYLANQTYEIERIVVVGSEEGDVSGLNLHPLARSCKAVILLSEAGSCAQRNAGLEIILPLTQQNNPKDWFVAFFDDDFRPQLNWIESCANTFLRYPNKVGMCGKLLADGVKHLGLTEKEVQDYLSGKIKSQATGWDFNDLFDIGCLYGCNMAFKGTVARVERLDENLPLYGWQEDYDYCSRALKYGGLIYNPACIGVHMGISSGRTSGVRFGYSQIANPIYLYKKNTMPFKKVYQLISRNILSNFIRTILLNDQKDYRGRLYGNFKAICDLVLSKCHPLNVKNL